MNGRPRSAGATDLEDAEIVERVLAGERDLYRLLVQRYEGSLYRVARAMVLDADVADDLVQDAFVRAYVNLARCRDPRRFRFWLLSTLRNRALDHVKARRRQDVSLSDARVRSRVDSRAPEHADPAERLALEGLLSRALARLSQPLREAFVLRHVEECTFEEIAELLGTGTSAVKMRVHRARRQLQEWIEAEEEARRAPSRDPGRATPAGPAPRGHSAPSL
jgi:RNA polymerase sigma-70 factor (ECF subfamily)